VLADTALMRNLTRNAIDGVKPFEAGDTIRRVDPVLRHDWHPPDRHAGRVAIVCKRESSSSSRTHYASLLKSLVRTAARRASRR
jgi:hypothetical protein